MPTRRTEPTDDSRTQPEAATAQANGPLHQPDPDDTNPAGDQDIDTAGTDADDESPTKAMGTGIARPRSRG
jgi:hypothetical protein